jgi:hypothetical protein
MTENESYNGWKNYETWSVALFLDNDMDYYNYVCLVVKDLTSDDSTKCIAIKDFVETSVLNIDKQNIYVQQLLNASLSVVDWREILKHYSEN